MTARIRARDAHGILEIVEDLAVAANAEDLVDRLLRHIFTIIPSLSVSFNWFAPGRIDYVIYPPMPQDDNPRLERLMLKNWRENPLVRHFLDTEATRALRWGDVADLPEWRRSVLYREFYAPLGISDQLGLRMPGPPGVAAAIVANGRRPFDDRDVEVLTRLGRHAITQLGALSDRVAMRSALDELGWSHLLVDGDGRVVSDASTSASMARFIDGDHRVSADLRAVVSGAPEPSSPRDPPALHTARADLDTILARGAVPPHSLFLRAGKDAGTDATAALSGAGLSDREIEVAMLLRDGASNAAIAGQLGIAVGTVKKHLERVFRALAVGNRTAAAAAISRLVPAQPDSRI